MSKIVGLDIGYSHIKLFSDGLKITFPSVVGSPDESSFKVTGSSDTFKITLKSGNVYNVGKAAIRQSRFQFREENRDWYNSDEYEVLLNAALSYLQESGSISIVATTGLPVSFYTKDKEKIKTRFMGNHLVKRDQREPLNVHIEECWVLPQVMGTLINAALDFEGNFSDIQFARGRIGVIDIGGKTTNILHASEMGNVDRETDTLDIGGWDVVRAIQPVIDDKCPDVDFTDHEIQVAIINKTIKYRGEPIDLSEEVDSVLSDMTREIVNKAHQLWPGKGARLDAVLLSGGGSMLMGEMLKEKLDHGNTTIVEDGVWANAMGYYKFGVFKQRG